MPQEWLRVLRQNNIGTARWIKFKLSVCVAIEVNLKQNNNISLFRDLGDYSLNALYANLIKIDL